MARADPAGGGVPEARHEFVATGVHPRGVVLCAGWPVGMSIVFHPAPVFAFVSVGDSGSLDRDPGGQPNLSVPPADEGL